MYFNKCVCCAGTEMEHEPRGVAHDSDVLLRRPGQGAQTHGGHPHGEGYQPSHAQEVLPLINTAHVQVTYLVVRKTRKYMATLCVNKER